MFFEYAKALSADGRKGFYVDRITIIAGLQNAVEGLRFSDELSDACVKIPHTTFFGFKKCDFVFFPEKNKHPENIVEEAVRSVDWHKNPKVLPTFYVSHNPDFVSAVRCYAEQEGMLDQIRFYLCDDEDNIFRECCDDSERNIEPIFKSFARALYMISDFGSQEGDE